jgi:hypothetical protein
MNHITCGMPSSMARAQASGELADGPGEGAPLLASRNSCMG